ncbi:hypothetical protein [Paenibacillus sp. J45TS6]|nr:hypothetical protein [Paenibacillus sp. J45TS6]
MRGIAKQRLDYADALPGEKQQRTFYLVDASRSGNEMDGINRVEAIKN